MNRPIFLSAAIVFCASAAFADVGALSFCPDTSRTSEDSLWVVVAEASSATHDSLTVPPQSLEGPAPQPVYPDSALAMGVSGQVIVAAYIGKHGEMMAWQPLRVEPAGWGFDRAVEKVICQWRFSPATRLGIPVNARIGIPFNFEPEKK